MNDGKRKHRDYPQSVDFFGGYRLDPLGPTEYAPGSLEKMVVMRSRAERRVALFHPLDRQEGDRRRLGQCGHALSRRKQAQRVQQVEESLPAQPFTAARDLH